jgi:hypothetical protein
MKRVRVVVVWVVILRQGLKMEAAWSFLTTQMTTT